LIAGRILVATITLLLATSVLFEFAITTASTGIKQAGNILVKPIPGLPEDFILGVDVSEALWILELGGKYYNNGVEEHPLDILVKHGVKWVRIRVWNDPYTQSGIPYGGCNCDPERVSKFAVEAKKRELKLLINLHYSDWWADPGRQIKPKAWANLSFTELVNVVYEWTYSLISYLNQLGAKPDIVQVGNEINNGFLWPDGSVENWDGFVVLLKSAIRAIREASPETRIAIHLAGVNADFYEYFFSRLSVSGVEYDIIGVSYYPYYHGSLSRLRQFLKRISQRFSDKEILVLETAYAWTLEDADGYPNIFGLREHEITGGYKASIQGQASYLRDLVEIVYTETRGKGIGVFYFGAMWIPVKGAGWKIGEGNPWENQAFFDFNGNALPSLSVFRLLYEGVYFELKPLILYEDKPLLVTTRVNEKPTLPTTVLVVFTDHSIKPARVVWPEIPIYSEPGIYELRGFVENTELQVIVLVSVIGESTVTALGSSIGDQLVVTTSIEEKQVNLVVLGVVIVLVTVFLVLCLVKSLH